MKGRAEAGVAEWQIKVEAHVRREIPTQTQTAGLDCTISGGPPEPEMHNS